MLIHVLLVWLLLSIGSLVSSNSCLRNSLMSSSHLFLGLPIALLVLYLALSSRFQSAAFLSHLSHGDVAILSVSFHFIFCESCSSIESLRFPSFPWLLQCFSLCIQCNLLLLSQLYQFPRRHRLQITLRCPRHLESLCSDHHHSHHQCCTFH